MKKKASDNPLNSFSALTYKNNLTEPRKRENLSFPLSGFFSLPLTFHTAMENQSSTLRPNISQHR